LAVLRISDNKQKKVSLRLCKRYHMPLVGMDMADSAAYAKARPVRIRSHKKEGGRLRYLVAMLTQENEICEWVDWWMLPPSMVQNYRTEVELNPSLVLYSVGAEVSVWWPAMRRTFKGVVESLTGNLTRVMSDDGDKGEAYVAVDEQVVQAEEYNEEQLRREREEARLAEEERQMRADSNAGTATRRGRVPGSKNKVHGTRKRGYQQVPRPTRVTQAAMEMKGTSSEAAKPESSSECPFANFPMGITHVEGVEMCRKYQFAMCREGENCAQRHVCHCCGQRNDADKLCEGAEKEVVKWRESLRKMQGCAEKEAVPSTMER